MDKRIKKKKFVKMKNDIYLLQYVRQTKGGKQDFFLLDTGQ